MEKSIVTKLHMENVLGLLEGESNAQVIGKIRQMHHMLLGFFKGIGSINWLGKKLKEKTVIRFS